MSIGRYILLVLIFLIVLIAIFISETFITSDKKITITKINRSHCGVLAMGPPGDVGPVGDTGDEGDEGEIGPDGFIGEIGLSIIGPTGPTGPKGISAIKPKLETLSGNVLNNLAEEINVIQDDADADFFKLSGGTEDIDLNRPQCPVNVLNKFGAGYMFALSYNDVPRCHSILTTINIPVRKEFLTRLSEFNGTYYNVDYNECYKWATIYLVYGNYDLELMKNMYLLSTKNYVKESIPVCFPCTGNVFNKTDTSTTLSTKCPNSIEGIQFAFLNPASYGNGYGLSTLYEQENISLAVRQDNYESLHTTLEPISRRFVKGNAYMNLNLADRIWFKPYLRYVNFLPIVDYNTIKIDYSNYIQKMVTVTWNKTTTNSYKVIVFNPDNVKIFDSGIINNNSVTVNNLIYDITYTIYIIGIYETGESMKSVAKTFRLSNNTI